jgi:hypothetical protein
VSEERAWVAVESDWSYFVDPTSFRLVRAKGRAPVGSIVLEKSRETNEVTGGTLVITSFSSAGPEGLEPFAGKTEASEQLLAQMIGYMRATSHWPPHTRVAQTFKNGNVKLEYAPGEYDRFALKLTDEHCGEDPSAFLERLAAHVDVPDAGGPSWSIERAKSGRAACRTCGKKIEKDDLRLGEPSSFEDRITYKWHHLGCAAKCVREPTTLLGYGKLSDDERAEVADEVGA